MQSEVILQSEVLDIYCILHEIRSHSLRKKFELLVISGNMSV